jgi:DNA-directed RNA polymerase specialized sigma24 family protein
MLNDPTDKQLLKRYLNDGAEDAFATLVQRYLALVYGVALRRLYDPTRAQEVTQSVFITLARQSLWLSRHSSLAGWLHRTAHNLAQHEWRAEERRRQREQTALQLGTCMKTVIAQVREELRHDLRADLMTALDPEREVEDGSQRQLRLIIQSDLAKANAHQYRNLMEVVQQQRQQDHEGVLALIKDVREQQITDCLALRQDSSRQSAKPDEAPAGPGKPNQPRRISAGTPQVPSRMTVLTIRIKKRNADALEANRMSADDFFHAAEIANYLGPIVENGAVNDYYSAFHTR